MSHRTCISHLTQLIHNTLINKPTTSSPPALPPTPNNTGLIVPFPPRPTHQPSSNLNAPSAFSPTNFLAPRLTNRQKATALLNHLSATHERRRRAAAPASTDGTSWDVRVRGVDGWDVGWEEMTRMFVKRKGRGVFRFEGAVMQGYGGFGDDEDDEEMVDGERRMEDGFEYREWVDEGSEGLVRGDGDREEEGDKTGEAGEAAVEESR